MHVFHYSVLRFHHSDISSLEIHINNTYVAMQKEFRKQEGGPDIELYVGGREKLKQMQHSKPPFKANDNVMLNKLLSAVARLCASHYATIDVDELNERYGPRSSNSPGVREGPSLASNDPTLGFHLFSRGGKSRIQGKGVPTSRSPQPVPSWALQPETTRVMPASQQDGDFHTHRYLTGIFEQFGGAHWDPKDETKSEKDLFQVRRLGDVVNHSTPASRQESATSQSQHGSRGSNRRAAKTRRTRGDQSSVTHDSEGGDGSSIVDDNSGNIAGSELAAQKGKRKAHTELE